MTSWYLDRCLGLCLVTSIHRTSHSATMGPITACLQLNRTPGLTQHQTSVQFSVFLFKSKCLPNFRLWPASAQSEMLFCSYLTCWVQPGRLVLNLERGLETSTDWWNSSMDVLISIMLTADLRSVEFSPTGKVQFWSCEGSGPFHVSCCSLIRFMFDSDVCFHGNAATTWEPCSNSPFSAAPPL